MKSKAMQANDPITFGRFRKSFAPRAIPGRVLLGSAIFCGLFSMLEFTTAIRKYFAPPNTVLSDSFRKDAVLIAVILGVVFFLLAVILGALYYAHKKHRVDLYELGIVVVDWRGSISFPWDYIDDLQMMPIYGRSRKPVNWEFTIVRADGVKAKFRGLEGLETLGRVLKQEISKSESQSGFEK